VAATRGRPVACACVPGEAVSRGDQVRHCRGRPGGMRMRSRCCFGSTTMLLSLSADTGQEFHGVEQGRGAYRFHHRRRWSSASQSVCGLPRACPGAEGGQAPNRGAFQPVATKQDPAVLLSLLRCGRVGSSMNHVPAAETQHGMFIVAAMLLSLLRCCRRRWVRPEKRDIYRERGSPATHTCSQGRTGSATMRPRWSPVGGPGEKPAVRA